MPQLLWSSWKDTYQARASTPLREIPDRPVCPSPSTARRVVSFSSSHKSRSVMSHPPESKIGSPLTRSDAAATVGPRGRGRRQGSPASWPSALRIPSQFQNQVIDRTHPEQISRSFAIISRRSGIQRPRPASEDCTSASPAAVRCDGRPLWGVGGPLWARGTSARCTCGCRGLRWVIRVPPGNKLVQNRTWRA
jgi:hypothetical protein